MDFHLGDDEVTLNVRPYEKRYGKLLTVTLDDFDSLHRAIDIIDANVLVFLFQNKGKVTNYIHQLYHYIPVLTRTAIGVTKVFLNVGWRFLFPSSKAFDFNAEKKPLGDHLGISVPQE